MHPGVEKSAPERVAAALRADILNGTIAPGSRVTEASVVERFNVGRPTVRSALSILADQRLLVIVRHVGASVPTLDRALIDEVFDFRIALELSALRLALERNADFARMTQAVEQLATLPEDADWHTLMEAHQRIHRALVLEAANTRLLDAYERCADEMQLLNVALRPDFSQRELETLHTELVNDVRRGGETAVHALLHDIQQNGRATLIARLATATAAAAAPSRA